MADLKKVLADLRLEQKAKMEQAQAILGKETVTDTDEKLAGELVSDAKRIGDELKKKGQLLDDMQATLEQMASYTSTDARSNGAATENKATTRGNLGTAQAEVNFREKVAYASWGMKAQDMPLLQSEAYAEAFGEFMAGRELSSETKSILDKGLVGLVKNQPEYLFPLYFQKDLVNGTAASAGYLSPNQFIPQIFEKQPGPTPLYERTTRIQTSAKAVDMPRSAYSTDNQYTSAARVSWVNEQPAATTFPAYGHKSDDTTFEQVSLTVGTVMVYMDLSENLLEDSVVGALDYVNRKFSEAYSQDRESKILLGSGTSGVPQGIITLAQSAETINLTRVASGTADDFGAEDVYALQDALPEQYEFGAVWIGRKATRSKIRQFTQGNYPVFYTGVNNTMNVLLDAPFLTTGFMPLRNDATNKIPLLYGNLAGYTVIERVGFGVRQNPYIRSTANTVRLEGRGRYTGKMLEPWWMAYLECEVS